MKGSARVKTRNWWQLVFISEHGVYHTIVPTQSLAEITEVLGQLAVKAWVSGCYGAQLKAPSDLHYPQVPPTNNESEEALRGSVVHRKVTNGFRWEQGAKAYPALQTILATAKQKGEQAFQTLASPMGTPVLPFLEAPSP